ncbi:MAG: hypothetical protein ACE5JO_05585 [Candidatus Binatia bacterium]
MKSQDELILDNRGIQVHVEYRHVGGDEGWTFHVYGIEKRNEVELLRFDCFKRNPHYHYDPSGKNEEHDMDKEKIPEPLGWVMTQLKTQLPAMIEHAGYGDIARAVDQNAMAQTLAKLEKEIERFKPSASP